MLRMSRQETSATPAYADGPTFIVRQLFPLPNCQRANLATAFRRLSALRLARSSRIRDSNAPARSQARINNIGKPTRDLECGDDRDRTGNLRLAKPALSQLSYVPGSGDRGQEPNLLPPVSWLLAMGILGFEPRTSALSELRSSQLSYIPPCSVHVGLYAATLAAKQKSQTEFGLALSSFRLG